MQQVAMSDTERNIEKCLVLLVFLCLLSLISPTLATSPPLHSAGFMLWRLLSVTLVLRVRVVPDESRAEDQGQPPDQRISGHYTVCQGLEQVIFVSART